MKVQEVIMRAMARKITWYEAAEIIGISCRQMRFARAAKQSGTAFTACHRKDLDLVFTLQHERMVARDNTVSYGNRVLQIEKSKWRSQ